MAGEQETIFPAAPGAGVEGIGSPMFSGMGRHHLSLEDTGSPANSDPSMSPLYFADPNNPMHRGMDGGMDGPGGPYHPGVYQTPDGQLFYASVSPDGNQVDMVPVVVSPTGEMMMVMPDSPDESYLQGMPEMFGEAEMAHEKHLGGVVHMMGKGVKGDGKGGFIMVKGGKGVAVEMGKGKGKGKTGSKGLVGKGSTSLSSKAKKGKGKGKEKKGTTNSTKVVQQHAKDKPKGEEKGKGKTRGKNPTNDTTMFIPRHPEDFVRPTQLEEMFAEQAASQVLSS